MKIRETFYTSVAIMALAAYLALGTAAWANSIPGTSLTPTVWWEADAANNITNNGLVSQLTDQSGNGNNAVQDTQNGTPLPLFATNVINGLPALSFGGTNSLISPTGATTGNSSHSIFIVASYQSIAQYRNGAVFYSDTAGSDQNSCLGVNPAGNTIWVGGYNEDNAPYVGSISLNGAGFNILSKIYTASSTNYQGFVSGVQDVNASGAPYNLGNTRVGLGKQYNNGSYWAGDIAEVIVFNSALSYADLEAVQQYLANKYNLPLALPGISLTASTPYAAIGSNVVVTVTLPVLTTTTTVTITSDNPSVTGFSSTNLTFTLGATNVQTFVAQILAVGTAHLTASNPSFNNGTLVVGGLASATIIEDYQASSLTNLNGGVAVNNGDSITAWAGDFNNSWVWAPNAGGVDPTFQAQATRALTPAIDFQGGSLGLGGGTSGLVAGRANFSVALVFQAAATGIGNSGDQWGNQTGIIDDTPVGGGVSGNYFGISISGNGEISAGLGSAANTTTISKLNYNLVTSTYHVAVASYDTLNGQMRLTVDDQPTVTSSGPISSGTMADLDLTMGGSSSQAATRYFSGAIAETRFYDGALTVAEATNLIQTLKTNYSILYPSEVSVLLTPANTWLLGGSNTVLTLTIPQAANVGQAVTVTVTNNNPGVVSLQGAVGNILTVTFPANTTNAQSVVVTGVGAGQASLTYASAGLVPASPVSINVAVGVSVIPVTGGDPGQGFSPLPIDVAAVDFDSLTPNQTIQGVAFTAGVPTSVGGTFFIGGYNGYTAPAFTPTDANNTAMSAVFSGFYYVGTPQQSTIGGNAYAQYQFTGLTVGKTYQADLFTIADSNPRYTLTQVVGAATNTYDVLTGLTPQIVEYTMTPDASGNITVQYCWGTGSVAGSSGNSALISAIALTAGLDSTSLLLTPANTSLLDGSNAVLTLTIPPAANASHAVTVTVTNNNPSVVNLQGAVGNILTVTFLTGTTNAQSVVVTGVGAGQASLTYASTGLVPAAPATINVVIPTSMIGHWLSGSQSFADTSGYKAPGTHDGVPTGANYYWTNDVPTSRSGYSLAFPASNPDTVILITNTWDTLSADPGYQQTFDGDIVNDFSVAVWAKGFPGTWNPWMSKYGENGDGWQIRQFDTQSKSAFTVRGAQTAGDLESSINSNDGNWHYYVGTYSAELGLQRIYVDGVLSGQGNVSGSWTPAPYEPMIICGKSNGDGTPTSMATYGEEITSAAVYDIRIYNYALESSQVSQLYSGAPTLGATRSGSSLILTWPAGSTLLQATNLLGPWTTNINTSPYTVTPAGPQMFFKAQTP